MSKESLFSAPQDTYEDNLDAKIAAIAAAGDARNKDTGYDPTDPSRKKHGWANPENGQMPQGGIHPLPEVTGSEGSRGDYSDTTSGEFGFGIAAKGSADEAAALRGIAAGRAELRKDEF